MDLITHAFFAIILYGKIDIFLIIGSFFPDLDKIFTYTKKHFRGAESRTPFTELIIMPLIAIVGYFISPAFSFGIISHILLDFITGETKPFSPFSDEKVNFNWGLKTKVIIGGTIWTLGMFLIGSGIV